MSLKSGFLEFCVSSMQSSKLCIACSIYFCEQYYPCTAVSVPLCSYFGNWHIYFWYISGIYSHRVVWTMLLNNSALHFYVFSAVDAGRFWCWHQFNWHSARQKTPSRVRFPRWATQNNLIRWWHMTHTTTPIKNDGLSENWIHIQHTPIDSGVPLLWHIIRKLTGELEKSHVGHTLLKVLPCVGQN